MGQLLGIKIVSSEFVAFIQLADFKNINTSVSLLSNKSISMATFMLCGFANLASIGIQIGGIGALEPKQRKNLSENIKVISIVDKYLEHPRVYHFINGGSPKTYISSADFMTRNIENRVEVAVPIYDIELQRQIIDVLDIIWSDNLKARKLNGSVQNKFVKNKNKPIRSQFEIFDYYKREAGL